MKIRIKNGWVVDKTTGRNEPSDIYISDGTIVQIGNTGEYTNASSDFQEMDAANCYISAGLIDLHTHVFPSQGSNSIGIRADQIGIEQGVTTLVDAGGAGSHNFNQFIDQAVDKNLTRILAWLNISEIGIPDSRDELKDLNHINQEKMIELALHSTLIRGIKVRMSSSVLGENGIKPLVEAKTIAQKLALPIMVHIGNGPPSLGEIYNLLDKGDVVTHAFHGKKGGILTDTGAIIPEAQAALARGVLLDIGHGEASFSFETFKKAREHSVEPNTISTDIHRFNYQGPVYSLAWTLSKFLALGYTLPTVLEMATINPAKILGLEDQIGVLEVGRHADLTIFEIEEGKFDFMDADKKILTGSQKIVPKYVVRAGVVIKCKE